MQYNPFSYWEKRGKRYKHKERPGELEILIDIINEFNYMNPLEIGSGNGRVYNSLKGQGGFVEKHQPFMDNFKMCDIVDSFIKNCEEETGIKPDKWNGKTLPYESDQFDLVISFSVALHVRPEAIRNFLSEHVKVSNKHIFLATWHEKDYVNCSENHCFMHDYYKLFADLYLNIIYDYDCYLCENKFLRKVWLLEI